MEPFTGRLLPPEPHIDQVRELLPEYEILLATVMGAIVDRYERSPDYPFIDTKLDLTSGRDFPEDDPIRGRSAVYGWIQGRGLEALAGHGLWAGKHSDERVASLAPRIDAQASGRRPSTARRRPRLSSTWAVSRAPPKPRATARLSS